MATKNQKLWQLIRMYKEETGRTDVDMHEVARYIAGKGWPLPKPPDPLDLLAKELSQAAREEVRRDGHTGRPYRVNHAYTEVHGTHQLTLWVDIDEAPRTSMLKCFYLRREQMVGDGLQLFLDAEHWNGVHGSEEPIHIDLDLTDDINWRVNAPGEEEKAS